MPQREVAHLSFIESHTGHEVFMAIRVLDEFVMILLTGRYSGDIAVYLDPGERKQVLGALEEAIRVVEDTKGLMEQEIASIRSTRANTKLQCVVIIRVEKGLVVLDLALEGVEYEEDEAWTFLDIDQCKWLVEALRRAN